MTMESRRPVRILLTAFGSFPDVPVNPAEALAKDLTTLFRQHKDISVSNVTLRTVFNGCYDELKKAIEDHKPDFVIAFGVRPKAGRIYLETLAHNRIRDRTDRKDASGRALPNGPIDPAGPKSYPAGLPVQAMYDALNREGIPVRLSKSAGGYVCNYLFYSMMAAIESGDLKIRAGFVHIPYSRELAHSYEGKKKLRPLPQKTLLKAGRLIVETAAASLRNEP